MVEVIHPTYVNEERNFKVVSTIKIINIAKLLYHIIEKTRHFRCNESASTTHIKILIDEIFYILSYLSFQHYYALKIK